MAKKKTVIPAKSSEIRKAIFDGIRDNATGIVTLIKEYPDDEIVEECIMYAVQCDRLKILKDIVNMSPKDICLLETMSVATVYGHTDIVDYLKDTYSDEYECFCCGDEIYKLIRAAVYGGLAELANMYADDIDPDSEFAEFDLPELDHDFAKICLDVDASIIIKLIKKNHYIFGDDREDLFDLLADLPIEKFTTICEELPLSGDFKTLRHNTLVNVIAKGDLEKLNLLITKYKIIDDVDYMCLDNLKLVADMDIDFAVKIVIKNNINGDGLNYLLAKAYTDNREVLITKLTNYIKHPTLAKFYIAIRNCDTSIILSYLKSVDYDPMTAIISAIQSRDTSILKIVLGEINRNNMCLEMCLDDILEKTVKYVRCKMIKVLIDDGIKINHPLDIIERVMANGRFKLFKSLIEGNDTIGKCCTVDELLEIALDTVKSNPGQYIRYLVEAGAAPTEDAMDRSITRVDLDTIKVLVEHGFKIEMDIINDIYRTPYISSNFSDMMEFLVHEFISQTLTRLREADEMAKLVE